ncbi:VWA domain-containing protein [Myxococcus sp. K38C18041901]|uniref:vWA domain-containing protein n=1 Tax=Myxococcus guangdongensis TaxID=2906760 RepID=UPI0020A8314C|nr:vWA domain-containing protein [Myxococcus guangdongensis]MCP3057562.1 VWA domain-containing protein [Myxococcus guangdongensis]
MKPALKLPIILGSAAALAVSALLLGKPSPGDTPASVVVAPPVAPPAPVAVIPSPPVAPTVTPVVDSKTAPVIQIALLLDTSGSMDGLLDQARTQLWNIVNRFAKAKRGGAAPRLELALYTYGDTTPGSSANEIRQVTAFTSDLDALSERLFALRTSGGSEHGGEVIQEATQKLEWSAKEDSMRLIFVAGNETFIQGPVDYREAVAAARKKGITVNTIHCGDYEQGIADHWKDAATRADGSYMNIDQNLKVVELAAPQDEEIARLGAELNNTYVVYGGAEAKESQQRQATQDKLSRGVSLSNMASRAMAKSSGNYSNESWDLVDAVKKNKVDLGAVAAEELPEPMRNLDAEGRKAWLTAREKEREALQQRIQQLGKERQQFLAEARKTQATEGDDTLDGVIGQVVQREASKRSFTLE